MAKGCCAPVDWLQALQRSARVKQRAQAFLAVSDAPSQEAPRFQSAALSDPLPPPAPALAVSEAEAPTVSPSHPVPDVSQPRSCRLSRQRKQRTARKRVKSSSQKSSEASADVCPCGTPLARLKGHRTKQFCSNGCRQRHYREQQKSVQQPSPPDPVATLLGSSRSLVPHPRKRGTSCQTKEVIGSPQGADEVKGETCSCGKSLVQSMGGRRREYCSDRCRQRAYRQRQAKR